MPCSTSSTSSRSPDQLKRDIEPVARLQFALAGELDFPWLRAVIGRLPADSHWDTLAKAALRDDLAGMLRALAADALKSNGSDPASMIAAWKKRNAVLYERFRQVLADLRTVAVARSRHAFGRDARAAQPGALSFRAT